MTDFFRQAEVTEVDEAVAEALHVVLREEVGATGAVEVVVEEVHSVSRAVRKLSL